MMKLRKPLRCRIPKDKKNRNKTLRCKIASFIIFRYFYEMCFKIKNQKFPENHLAKYANIPALYEES